MKIKKRAKCVEKKEEDDDAGNKFYHIIFAPTILQDINL
jgi:hypothetical protein